VEFTKAVSLTTREPLRYRHHRQLWTCASPQADRRCLALGTKRHVHLHPSLLMNPSAVRICPRRRRVFPLTQRHISSPRGPRLSQGVTPRCSNGFGVVMGGFLFELSGCWRQIALAIRKTRKGQEDESHRQLPATGGPRRLMLAFIFRIPCDNKFCFSLFSGFP